MLKNPVLSSVTARYVETAGQAVLRWHVESGRAALVETSKAARMVENRDIDDFELGDDEMRRIDALGAGQARCTCPFPSTFVKEHPPLCVSVTRIPRVKVARIDSSDTAAADDAAATLQIVVFVRTGSLRDC